MSEWVCEWERETHLNRKRATMMKTNKKPQKESHAWKSSKNKNKNWKVDERQHSSLPIHMQMNHTHSARLKICLIFLMLLLYRSSSSSSSDSMKERETLFYNNLFLNANDDGEKMKEREIHWMCKHRDVESEKY